MAFYWLSRIEEFKPKGADLPQLRSFVRGIMPLSSGGNPKVRASRDKE